MKRFFLFENILKICLLKNTNQFLPEMANYLKIFYFCIIIFATNTYIYIYKLFKSVEISL